MDCKTIEIEIEKTQAVIDGVNKDKDDISGADVVDTVLWFPFNLIAKQQNYSEALAAAERRMVRLHDLLEKHNCATTHIGAGSEKVEKEFLSDNFAAPSAEPTVDNLQVGSPRELNQGELDRLFESGTKRSVDLTTRGWSDATIRCTTTRNCTIGRQNLSITIGTISRAGNFKIIAPHRFLDNLNTQRARAVLNTDSSVSIIDYSYAKPATLMYFPPGVAPDF